MNSNDINPGRRVEDGLPESPGPCDCNTEKDNETNWVIDLGGERALFSAMIKAAKKSPLFVFSLGDILGEQHEQQ